MYDRHPLLMAGKILPALLLLGVMMKQGHVSAFSATSKMATGRAHIPSKQSAYRYMAQDDDARLDPLDFDDEDDYEDEFDDDEDDEDEDELEIDDMAFPAPPKSFPAVDAQLAQDLQDTERRIGLYVAEIEMMREQLCLKNDELMEERNAFREEKETLMELIADLSTNLALRYEELESRQGLVGNFEERETSMQTQIDELSERLTEKNEAKLEATVPTVQPPVEDQMEMQPDQTTLQSEQVEMQPDQTTLPSEQVAMEPEQALVEPEQTLMEPEQASVEPERTLRKPEQTLIEPDQPFNFPDQARPMQPDRKMLQPDQAFQPKKSARRPKVRTPFRQLSPTSTLHGNDFGIIFLE
jgi:hypothetical protein